jgi:hypothetical protein
MSYLREALDWARTAEPGEYLAEYDGDGFDDRSDPGSRCGYGDDELDAIDTELSKRGITLAADDTGLVAREAGGQYR